MVGKAVALAWRFPEARVGMLVLVVRMLAFPLHSDTVSEAHPAARGARAGRLQRGRGGRPAMRGRVDGGWGEGGRAQRTGYKN